MCLAAQAGCGAPPDDGATAETSSEESGLEAAFNGYGVGSTLHTSGAIDRTNPFFQALGTNPRSCETCHSSAAGWTTSSAMNTGLLLFTQGQAPLFNLVDEGNRPDADISTFSARINTFKATLAERGLTRFTRKVSPTAEFSLIAVDDPYGWSTTTAYSGFRRPTPTANETKASSILWTGSPTTTVIAQLQRHPGGRRHAARAA